MKNESKGMSTLRGPSRVRPSGLSAKRLTAVPPSVCYLKRTLASVGGSGRVRDEVVLDNAHIIHKLADADVKTLVHTILQVYVVGVPSTTARQMLKYWHIPPVGSAGRVLQRDAQVSTSYLSRNAKPMYWCLLENVCQWRLIIATYAWSIVGTARRPINQFILIRGWWFSE
jgi:hypothetical protein